MNREGVLGVDIGSDATIIAAALVMEKKHAVLPRSGVGSGSAGVIEKNSLELIKRWMPIELSDNEIQDYIYNKSIYPDLLPLDIEHLEIEFAVAKQALRFAAEQSIPDLPKTARGWRYAAAIYGADHWVRKNPDPGSQTLSAPIDFA